MYTVAKILPVQRTLTGRSPRVVCQYQLLDCCDIELELAAVRVHRAGRYDTLQGDTWSFTVESIIESSAEQQISRSTRAYSFVPGTSWHLDNRCFSPWPAATFFAVPVIVEEAV